MTDSRLPERESAAAIAAVVVTFHPNPAQLRLLLRGLHGQVGTVYVVDNGSPELLRRQMLDVIGASLGKIYFLPQETNLGVAAAHNIGILAAKAKGLDYVLLLDQDSLPDPGMVSALYEAHKTLTHAGRAIAVLGPRYRDEQAKVLSNFVATGFGRFKQIKCECEHGLKSIDFLVSSGSLIPIAALDQVGLMDEALFIDHVDTEWCYRAKSFGWEVIGVCGASMQHSLGEQRKRIWLLRSRVLPCHKPFRYYYMIRNSIRLQSYRHMPINWRIADGIRCLKLLVIFGIIDANRKEKFRMMWLGALDAIKGRSGFRKLP